MILCAIKLKNNNVNNTSLSIYILYFFDRNIRIVPMENLGAITISLTD